MLLKVADRLVEEVSCVVHVSYVRLEGVVLFIEFVSLRILNSTFTCKLFRLSDAVLIKLLLILFKLHQEAVEHFDLVYLSFKHIFMVALQFVVVHLCVTLVTNAVCRGVLIR